MFGFPQEIRRARLRHGAFLPNQLFIHFAILLALAQKVKRTFLHTLFYFLLIFAFYLLYAGKTAAH